MTTSQTFISPRKWFSLEYPRLWDMEVVDNIPAFFDPLGGQGALQVFSVQIGPREKIKKELEAFDFLKSEGLSAKMHHFLMNQQIVVPEEELTIYHRDQMQFIPYEYVLEGRFYMACMLQKKKIFLLVLYNCQGRPPPEEANTVSEIVRSIQIDV